MSSKFRAELKSVGPHLEIVLSGILDERCELPEIESLGQSQVMINLENVNLINSLGCRKWIQWLQSFAGRTQVVLRQCSPAVVNQMNILAGFLPESVRVESLMVPYHCEDCGLEQTVVFKPESQSVETIEDERTCAQCAGRLELDVMKARYFGFLQKRAG